MEDKSAKQETAYDPQSPATLTAEQAEQVGGALSLGGVLAAGCPTCTSGRSLAFQNLAAVVNPAPEVQALG